MNQVIPWENDERTREKRLENKRPAIIRPAFKLSVGNFLDCSIKS
jgi:hypothetical protein